MTPAVTHDPLLVANRLRPVLLRLSRQLRRETHALGLTGGQASLLAAIHGHPEYGVNALAAHEGISAASISGHIDRLAAAGLVERERSGEGDRRRVGLRVTRAGVRALEDVRRRRTAWLAKRLEALEPEELEALDAALDALTRVTEVQP
ncbi:MAG TPA: MarR family transcriptional regulator [Candidatus Dormibacteraeota bacterium]|nr:MarR family transcriptional regulator [Candidatus Dormibacteraeota bacterium]